MTYSFYACRKLCVDLKEAPALQEVPYKQQSFMNNLWALSQNCKKATISFVMSVRPSAWNNSALTGRLFIRFDIWGFFENLSRKLKLLCMISGFCNGLNVIFFVLNITQC